MALSQSGSSIRVSTAEARNEPGLRMERKLMDTKEHRLDPLDSLFRDVVLVLGGAFAVDGVEEATVQRIARGLRRAYERARGPSAKAATQSTNPAPHPAIAELLRLTDPKEPSHDL